MVGLSLGDIVLDFDPAHPPLKGHSPQFLANVGCGQTAGWIQKPLGTEVNLDPGDVMLMGSQLPLEGAQFSLDVYCSQMAGWTKTPLGTSEVDLGPGHIVIDGSQLTAKGAQQPPSLLPMSIVD